ATIWITRHVGLFLKDSVRPRLCHGSSLAGLLSISLHDSGISCTNEAAANTANKLASAAKNFRLMIGSLRVRGIMKSSRSRRANRAPGRGHKAGGGCAGGGGPTRPAF